MNQANRRFRVRYREGSAAIVAQHIRTWCRAEPVIQQGYVTGSSGPKDTTNNLIISAFAQTGADTIMMLLGNGVPFLLFGWRHAWVDVSGKEVEVSDAA